MADIETKTIDELTEKTSVSDTDLIPIGNEGTGSLRKITFSNVLTSLKTKFRDWLFDDLATTDKTVVGAINELNNGLDDLNILELGTAIRSGDDLNDYTTVGRYNSASSSISASLSNTPVTGAGFALFVFRAGSRRVQLLIIAGNMTSETARLMYFRNVSSGTWTNWYAVSGDRADV